MKIVRGAELEKIKVVISLFQFLISLSNAKSAEDLAFHISTAVDLVRHLASASIVDVTKIKGHT